MASPSRRCAILQEKQEPAPYPKPLVQIVPTNGVATRRERLRPRLCEGVICEAAGGRAFTFTHRIRSEDPP